MRISFYDFVCLFSSFENWWHYMTVFCGESFDDSEIVDTITDEASKRFFVKSAKFDGHGWLILLIDEDII